MKTRTVLVLLAMGPLAAAAGCSGASNADGDGDGTMADPSRPVTPGVGGRGGSSVPILPGQGGAAGGSTAALLAGVRPIHRLTRAEYRNTLRDLQLVDDVDAVIKDLPGDTRAAFGYELATDISNLEVDRYYGVAAEVGRRVMDPARMKQLVPCDPATGTDACARDFVVKMGRRIYRRPLDAEEVTQLTGLFTRVRTELKYGFADGIRMVLQAMLQSPSFLYRWEVGPGKPAVQGGLVKLSGHELASRLSYLLWGSMPDQALFDAADAGKLGTPAEVTAQAERLLASDKAKDTLHRFHEQWLEIEALANAQKDPKVVAGFPALAASMGKETARFVEHVFVEAQGRLETLLGASYSFIDEPLAKLYGIPGVTGAELRRTNLTAGQRLGVLTHGAFLAAHSPPDGTSPVRRGKIVLERLLCSPPPPPPDGLDVMPPIPDPTKQTREQFDMHSTGACRACHVKMDNLGFAFEGYDTAGRFRTMEAGRPVNTRVTIPDLDGADRDFANAVELAQLRQLATAGPTKCTAPGVTGLDDPKAQPDGRYEDIMNVQLEMAVAALACNVTRIATVQLNNGHGNGVVYSWLGLSGKGMEFGVRDSHDLAHRPGTGNADKIEVENWYAQQFAALIDKMKAVKEGNGTLLDNTAVLWVNHMGNGGAHSSTKLPWVIAGRCGGYFKTGQFRRGTSVPTNGLLIALANAMEVPMATFGDPAYGGELSGLRA